MKKLFLLLALFSLLCVGCSELNDPIDTPQDPTEQPDEKPDDGSEIPDDAYITLNKEALTFVPDGESVEVKVYSNYEWTLTNNCDWVTAYISGGEASEEGTAITLTADLTYDDREGTITFSCGKAKKLLVVSQSFKEAIIADENNVFNVPAEGGNVIINYQTSVECEVIIPEEAKSWISLAPATRGLKSESATLTVAENTTYSERSAVVKVVKVGDNTLFAEYTINQVQNDAIIADENSTFNLNGCAQSINIAYQTNVECEVIIPEEAKSWISLAPATRALVDESAMLNIAENNTGAERSAVVKVVAANNSELVAEYTITQNQRYFIEYTSEGGYTVSPYNSAFGATIIRNEYIDGKGYIDFNAPITSIGYSAFSGCTSLTSITIPDSVTSIGDDAFGDCYSLRSVHITDIAAWCNISFGNDASNPLYYAGNLYLNNELVTDLIIPDSVTEIGDWAFFCYDLLTSVTIGNGVTSIGDNAFWNCSSLTSITIPDSVTSIGDGAFCKCTSLTSVTIGNGVTEIGNDAFHGCTSLTSITIPDSVTSIGNDAFNYCTSLTSITLGNGVTSIGDAAFCYCTSLTGVTIPDSVTSIGYGAFNKCTSLTSVTIGNGVTEIGDHVFYDCTSLTSVTIPDSVTSIGDRAFSGCTSLTSVTIPDSVTSIGDYAFSYCTSLTSITIPDSVTSIGGSAFGGCTSLTSVTIGKGVTSIGEDAFYYCTSLTSVYITDIAAWCNISFVNSYSNPLRYAENLYLNNELVTDLIIPDSVTKIGSYAFYDCTSLTSVTIGNGVTKIGDRAFYDCTSLTSVTISDSVTSIGSYAFSDCTSLKSVYTTDIAAWCNISFGNYASNPLYYAGNLYLNNELVTDLIIPDSATKIGSYAFYGYDLLTSVTIPDSVTSIGDYAFYNCTSLTSITIPDSVTSIGEEAFRYCTSLTSVTIPDSVTSIGDYAFRDCDSLKEVYCKPTTPPSGGYLMFGENASGRKIYVPSNSVSAYKSASGWSKYASDIVGYDF